MKVMLWLSNYTDSSQVNNAVWDDELEWCLKLVFCDCGKQIGIKVFHATNRPDLKNKASIILYITGMA